MALKNTEYFESYKVVLTEVTLGGFKGSILCRNYKESCFHYHLSTGALLFGQLGMVKPWLTPHIEMALVRLKKKAHNTLK